MGGDWIQNTITASSKEEAIAIYKKNPEWSNYEDFEGVFSFTARNVKFFDNVFDNEEEAHTFLATKVKKWDDFAAMCKCGHNKYAYDAILPN